MLIIGVDIIVCCRTGHWRGKVSFSSVLVKRGPQLFFISFKILHLKSVDYRFPPLSTAFGEI